MVEAEPLCAFPISGGRWLKRGPCMSSHLRGTFGSLQASCLLSDSDCHCEVTFAFRRFHSNPEQGLTLCFLIINWLWERT